MTDSEKLDLLLAEIRGTKEEIQSMKGDMQCMKDDMQDMKGDIQHLKDDMQLMKDDMQGMKDNMQLMKDDIEILKRRMAAVELHLENITDRNIRLLAENFINLINKLNEAISVADKSQIYEIKVTYFIEEVKKLAEEVEMIKKKIA